MREIKFRAWDKKYKVMAYVLEMTFMFESEKGIWVRGCTNDRIDHEIFPENLELMQYTGLKDKNGKEIYKGDLLARSNFGSWCVVWESPSFRVYNTLNPQLTFVLNKNEMEYREIIGNIYENPELLEEPNQNH